jgi:flagella basal body P-ring formation protein FlgA
MSAILAASLSALLLLSAEGTLVATEVIRAGDTLSETNTEPEDGVFSEEEIALLGREVRRTVYRGAAIDAQNTRSPRLVTRNQIVTVKYQSRGLEITLSGRAMGEGAAGEAVSVMNLETKKLINGQIMPEGWVLAR